MASTAPSGISPAAIENLLREELVTADRTLANVAPVLGHLLGNSDNSIFSDETIARVRGMLHDLAQQLVLALAEAAGHRDPESRARETAGQLFRVLVANRAVVAHVHAIALEWQLTERLQGRLGLDPVLPPLLQARIASPDAAASALAMSLLAAQARFGQTQRRMQLPLSELPGDLFRLALMAMHAFSTTEGPETNPFGEMHAGMADRILRERYDEGMTRLGLLYRVIGGMGSDAAAALSIDDAGVALFLTGLSIASACPRDDVTLALTDTQLPRLALLLAASGLKGGAIARQFLALHPEVELPEGLDALRPDRAAALLAASSGGYA